MKKNISIKIVAKEYARVWQNAILNGDIPPWEEMFDSSFVLHFEGGAVDWKGLRQHVIDLHDHSKVINLDIKFVTADRYLFALEYRGHFKLTDDMPGRLGVAGKEVKSSALCLFRVKDSKVIEEWANTTVTGLA